MDGLRRRLNESVQLKLSVTLSLAILAFASVAGVLSFMSAFDEAHELQDGLLRQVAHLIERQRMAVVLPGPVPRAVDTDEEARIIVQRLDAGGAAGPGVDAGGALSLPATLADGLHTVDVGGETFRVLVRTTATGERIAVAQESAFRNENARGGALRTVTPVLLLVPVLLLIVARLVRQMFGPIAALSKEIDQRAEQELHPVEERHLPVEVRPFAMAINRLLARARQAMESQRRFVADAAHELRSPLTALSLQAERLADAEMPAAARERLALLRQGIGRGRALLDQLLALARAQSPAEAPKAPVSVQAVFRRVLEDRMPLAEQKHLDIGVEGARDAGVAVTELDMIALVRNLVDNAIRYTPDGGRVDLSVRLVDGCAALRVRDTGPGIAPDERERVFGAFYRTIGNEEIGSGLGLSIVRAIAERIGAQVRLDWSDETARTGLAVTVLIPLAPPHDAA
ncbi:MAG: two-component sensor histidine kinase [Proteobacteria bacterium]|nr:two-component sensor histidine kinase [Pseudomonadota bacterium]